MNNETIAKKRSKNKGNIIYTLMGKPLSTENTQKMRVSRCIFYAKDTIGFSIVINLINLFVFKKSSLLIQTENIFLGLFVDVAFSFVTLFLVTFLWYEFRVYRHNLSNSK